MQFLLEAVVKLQREVGGAGVGNLLLARTDDSTVEVVGVAQFGSEMELGRDGGACQQHEVHALAVVHGKREVVAHLALVEIKPAVVVVGAKERSSGA